MRKKRRRRRRGRRKRERSRTRRSRNNICRYEWEQKRGQKAMEVKHCRNRSVSDFVVNNQSASVQEKQETCLHQHHIH